MPRENRGGAPKPGGGSCDITRSQNFVNFLRITFAKVNNMNFINGIKRLTLVLSIIITILVELYVFINMRGGYPRESWSSTFREMLLALVVFFLVWIVYFIFRYAIIPAIRYVVEGFKNK